MISSLTMKRYGWLVNLDHILNSTIGLRIIHENVLTTQNVANVFLIFKRGCTSFPELQKKFIGPQFFL